MSEATTSPASKVKHDEMPSKYKHTGDVTQDPLQLVEHLAPVEVWSQRLQLRNDSFILWGLSTGRVRETNRIDDDGTCGRAEI